MEEGPMKKSCLFFVIISFLVFALAGVSYGWQGRMAGMGDPYGLVEDESDFLIHPAGIANGKGINFYGGYRFNYTGVTDWSYNLDQFDPAGTLIGFYHYDTSGHEYRHDGLMGAAFPLGPGRMGFFFEYAGKRGDYDGNESRWGTSILTDCDLTSKLDNFALRLLYGLPFGGFKLGGEFQLAYRKEENRNDIPGRLNYIVGTSNPSLNLSPFQLPYDSKYWEALLKGSLEGKVGPADVEFTLRGGFIFSGDNSLVLTQGAGGFDSSGDVKGWNIGGDIWLRYPLSNGLTLPFLLIMDYQKKKRDGEGQGEGTFSPLNNYPYESKEQSLHLEAGGGVNKDFNKGTRIAAGIYYNYLHGKYDMTLDEIIGASRSIWDHSKYPASNEHQVMLRLAGEHEISPMVALRMGLNFFYGWVREDFKFTFGNPTPNYTDDIPLHGSHWGIGASLGGTVKFQRFTLEPFINAGYQKLDLKGDGERTQLNGTISNLWEMDKLRKEWSIGGGFSIKFN
jgi:hypothetical protein